MRSDQGNVEQQTSESQHLAMVKGEQSDKSIRQKAKEQASNFEICGPPTMMPNSPSWRAYVRETRDVLEKLLAMRGTSAYSAVDLSRQISQLEIKGKKVPLDLIASREAAEASGRIAQRKIDLLGMERRQNNQVWVERRKNHQASLVRSPALVRQRQPQSSPAPEPAVVQISAHPDEQSKIANRVSSAQFLHSELQSAVPKIECGREVRKHFALEDGFVNLNHGSYGTYPLEVRATLRKYQERAEARPDTFVRREYRTHLLDEARKAVADYLHAPLETCVLMPNASTGIDTILRNIIFQPKDIVITFSTTYPAFSNTMDHLHERFGVENVYILDNGSYSDEALCDALERTILQYAGKRPVRLALFDTISSQPALRMPFERFTEICRKHGVLSLVDGAHGIGQIPLDLSKLDPDFFVSNCHKWLYTPRGCAVLYVPERNQHLIRTTLPTGFNYVLKRDLNADTPSNFVANFAAVATYDDTPYLCIPTAIAWRQQITFNGKSGETAIMSYMNDLAQRGSKLVAKILGTEVMGNLERTNIQCAMANVRLPLDLFRLTESIPEGSSKLEKWIGDTMDLDYNIAVNVFYFDGCLWLRLSAQIYLQLEDFEAAGQALLKVCSRVRSGEWELMELRKAAPGLDEEIRSVTASLHASWLEPCDRSTADLSADS